MKTFKFETTEIMQNNISGYDVSLEIINSILNNLDLKEGEEIDAMCIITNDSDLIYEVGIAYEDLKETLRVNLKIMEEFEDYETCQKVINALKYLETNG